MPDVHRLPLQWSLFADRMLRQRARTMDALALAKSLGRTPMEVRARALALGVELSGEADVMDRGWGSGELSFLKQQFRRMTPAEIGRQLGRSESAVRRKLESLGLRKRPAEPRPAFLAPASGPEPDPAFSVNAIDSVAVAGIEAAERRMEQDVEPESAPWKDAEPAASKWAEPELEPESADLPAAEPAASKWAEMKPEMPAEASERPVEATEEAEAGKDAESAPELPGEAQRPFRWWSSDEDERLRQLAKEGTPLPELAELFGRAEDEVRRRIARVCAEPDPAVQAGNQRWGYGRTKKAKTKPKAAGPIPEERLASMSNLDVLRALAGLA